LYFGLAAGPWDGLRPPSGNGATGPALSRHFRKGAALTRGTSGGVYGRRTYEIMGVMDGKDQPELTQKDHGDFVSGVAKSNGKWVVSRTLKSSRPQKTPRWCRVTVLHPC